jgi:hypothetical protein
VFALSSHTRLDHFGNDHDGLDDLYHGFPSIPNITSRSMK